MWLGPPCCLVWPRPQHHHQHHHHLAFPVAAVGHFLHSLWTSGASRIQAPSSVLQIHQNHNAQEKSYKLAVTVTKWLGLFITSGLFIQNLLKWNRTLSGSWAQKPFCVPHFLITGSRLHSAPMTFPEFQWAGSNSCSSVKGGDAETREEQSRNNSAVLAQGPGAHSRDTHSNIFELFCRC